MYYFIVNPNSRSGKGKEIWRGLEKRLISSGMGYEACLTERPGSASDFAALLTEGCKEPRITVAMGGDGTANKVLNGLTFCGPITLGYTPTDSGNGLARGLKPSKRPGRCLKKTLNPRYHKLLDYGVMSYNLKEVAHRRFAVSAGISYGAAVCHNPLYSRLKRVLNKIRLGKLSYILISVKQLALAHPTKGYLLLDSMQKVESNRIYFIPAHIHPYEGGGLKFIPKAKPVGGTLGICVVHNAAKRKFIPILVSVHLEDRTNYCGVRHCICQEAEIHTDKTMPVYVDGESYYCQNDLQVRCIEKKLRLIV